MKATGAPGVGRIALVGVAAVLTAVQVVRNASVLDRERRPALAAAIWNSHPDMLTGKVLLDVATAATNGQPVPAATRVDVRRIAERAPLSPDPFLIEGAIAETQGKGAAAERLLLAARDRDPRSRGTRYLLADRFLRTGRVTQALVEIQALVGLHPRGKEPFIPMLVEYARTPGSAAHLKAFFQQYPAIESSVLTLLATDADNADLVLSLASGRKPSPDWRRPLIASLVAAGDYAKAHSTWLRLTGQAAGKPGLFNSRFAASDAAPPFNWSFPKNPEGIAEPDGNGGLEMLYYGRKDAVLAAQLLRLPPGAYALAHRVADASGEAGSVHWLVRCARPARVLADVPLRASGVQVDFRVPAGCDAVWIELLGVAGDLRRTTGLTVRDLRLVAGTAP